MSEALEKKDIVTYHKQQLHELDELRELVRGELTDNARETLKALIVIEVHARDVVINLIEEKVTNVNDFEWISQVRGNLSFEEKNVIAFSLVTLLLE